MKNLEHTKVLGEKVEKISGKPFKSGSKIATVKDICVNPNTILVAFTFIEDDSIVDAWKCKLVDVRELCPLCEHNKTHIVENQLMCPACGRVKYLDGDVEILSLKELNEFFINQELDGFKFIDIQGSIKIVPCEFTFIFESLTTNTRYAISGYQEKPVSKFETPAWSYADDDILNFKKV